MGRGGIARETLQPLVDAGMTIAQIAAEVERTPTTVRLWLQRHGLRTAASRHANAVREARADGNGVTLSLAALRAEASKCVLVCSNCHAELEGGVIELPLKIDCRLPSKVDERPAKDSSITP
jgi:hypothetical protein